MLFCQLEEEQAGFARVVAPTVGLPHSIANIAAVVDAFIMPDPQVAHTSLCAVRQADFEMIRRKPIVFSFYRVV